MLAAARRRDLLVAGAPTVVRVVDGDTLQVRTDAAVRTVHLAGVDAPERGACGSVEAGRALARLLPRGARVRLQRDAAAPGARYVYRRGRLVNAALLRDGVAKPGDTGGLREAPGTARRGTRGRAAAAGGLDVVRAARRRRHRTPRPPGRRRSRARVPSSPTGCSS